MKSLILVWLLAAGLANAAPTPLVKRQAAFYSPKHAVTVKQGAMRFSPAGGLLGTRLPMKGYCVGVTNSPHGKMELTAEALQPANQGVLFEYAVSMPASSWTTIAWFGGFPKAQQVFAGITTDEELVFIRATVTINPPAGLAPVLMSGGVAMRVNPAEPSARAWRGVR